MKCVDLYHVLFRMGPNVDTGDEMDIRIGYEHETVACSHIKYGHEVAFLITIQPNLFVSCSFIVIP